MEQKKQKLRKRQRKVRKRGREREWKKKEQPFAASGPTAVFERYPLSQFQLSEKRQAKPRNQRFFTI